MLGAPLDVDAPERVGRTLHRLGSVVIRSAMQACCPRIASGPRHGLRSADCPRSVGRLSRSSTHTQLLGLCRHALMLGHTSTRATSMSSLPGLARIGVCSGWMSIGRSQTMVPRSRWKRLSVTLCLSRAATILPSFDLGSRPTQLAPPVGRIPSSCFRPAEPVLHLCGGGGLSQGGLCDTRFRH